MTIFLSPETQELLERKVKAGQYRSADAVVLAALEALEQMAVEPLSESTLDAIDQAEDEIDAGKVHDWNDVREQVRARFLGK